MDPERWSRIEQLYHEAAALDIPARATFLTGACGDDRALLEEIESLLGENAAGDPFLDEPALAVAARLVADDIPVLTGRPFGPYRLEALLGAGAMGDVYRAHDTVLGRDVAIKILPEAFNDDPVRLARFRQEAQFLASLSHPNIAAIYGVHESDGMHGLVLELAEGETLAERIRRGPIPLHDAARIARQIGEGLDAAHQRGIVHRDLKPSNITITRDGTTKILDFGLAKSSAGAPDGLVIGTASYMSPEQARGDPVDKRTDIWAFGCVCFEMLTGVPAFRGPRAKHRVDAALEAQPRWSVMPSSVPASVTALLKRCLDEDPRRRRRDIGDVLVDLDGALSQRVEPAPRRPLSTWLVMSGAAFLVLAAAAMLLKAWRPSTENPGRFPESRLSMLSLLLPPGMDFPEQDNQIAVSPDGTTIAYVAAPVGGAPRLVLKKLDADSEYVVGDAISVRDPFFSPDGRWIAFFAGDTLRKMFIVDGQSRVVCPARRGESGSWSEGVIVFGEPGDLPTAGIRRVSDDGGSVEVVSSPDRRVGERAHQAPQMLPDGRTVMYTLKVQESTGLASRIVVQTPGKPPKVLLDNASYARYTGNSVLVYQRGHSLYATHVDLETLTTAGPGVMLFDDLSPSDRPFWSAGGGVLVYRPRNVNRRFVWVDRHGTEISLPSPLKPYRAPNLSPRGDRIAVDIVEDGKTDVWMLDIERQALTRFTSDGWSSYPMWTPDGTHVGLSRRREDTSDLYWQSPDGSGSRQLVRGQFRTWIGSWSRDMRTLIYMQEDPSTHSDLWAVDLQTKLSRPIVQTSAREYGGRLSPDGRWLAYFSDEISPDQFELYVTTLAPNAPHHRISTGGGAREAVWAKDGRELFYRHGSQLLSVRVPSDSAFSLGPAKVLFEGDYFLTGGPGIVNYDVSSDGQRFLMLKPIEDRAPQLKVVQGLDRLIRERLPQSGQ